jgi:hypothetical protein
LLVLIEFVNQCTTQGMENMKMSYMFSTKRAIIRV